MRPRLLSGMLMAILLATAATVETAAARREPVWEVVSARDLQATAEDSSVGETPERVEVSTRDGFVYITVDAPVEVQVVTILGQPVARRKIMPGTVRVALGHKGVYILKAGTVTKRINL